MYYILYLVQVRAHFTRWLANAKIINCCYNSTEPSIGLRLNEERTTLKCYMGDTGLLLSHAFDERGIVSSELYRKLMFDKLEVNVCTVENLTRLSHPIRRIFPTMRIGRFAGRMKQVDQQQ